MTKIRSLLLIITSALVVSFFPASALAKGEEIANVVVTIGPSGVAASATLKGPFASAIEEALKNGFSKEFRYTLNLYRSYNWWPDEFIAQKTILRHVKYDSVKKLYAVRSSDGDRSEEKSFTEFSQMLSWTGRLASVVVAPRSVLAPNEPYYIQLKAESRTPNIPAVLETILFFVSFNDFSTSWKTSPEFTLKEGTRSFLAPDLFPSGRLAAALIRETP